MTFMQISSKLFISTLVLATIFSCALFDKNQSGSPAEIFLKHQIEKNPKDATAHYQLGLHYYSGSRYQLASTQLQKAIEIKPDYAAAYLTLGSTLQHLGQFDASIDSFQKAINYKVDYWAEAYNLIGAAYRDRYFIKNEKSRESIDLSLTNFLKASERCTDAKNELCLSIFQNIFVSYMDLYAMSGNGDKKDDTYLRKAISYAKRALKPTDRQQDKYHYAMLHYSLGEAYLLLPGDDNSRNAEAAFNEALSGLDANTYPNEYNMVQNSLEMLKQGPGTDYLPEDATISSEDSNQPLITVQFITKENKPLGDGTATLIESSGDEFIRAHFRDRPLKRNGTISVPSSFLGLPSGSNLFVRTSDEYYFYSFKVTDIKKKVKPTDKKITLAVPKTGIITATIIGYEKGIEQPLVVPVFKLNERGIYEQFYGIGIGLAINYPFSISGLPAGTYRIEIKKNYEATNVYYRKDGIRVVAGQKMDLGGIELKVK